MLLTCVDVLVLGEYVGGISLNTCLYHIMMYYLHCECS
jgi:hypothetical protein